MKSKLYILGLCVTVAVVSFVAGSMLTSANAAPPASAVPIREKTWIGAVTDGNKIYGVWTDGDNVYWRVGQNY